MALPTASLFGFRLSLRPMSSHDHLLCLCGTGPAACLDPLFPRNTQCAGLSSWVALGILITTAKPHLQIQLPSGVPGAGLGHVNLRGHSLAHRTPRRDLCKSRAGGWGGALWVSWLSHAPCSPLGPRSEFQPCCFLGGSKHDMAGQWP